MITEINNHADLAKRRVLEQFKGSPRLLGMLDGLCINIQELENVFFDIKDNLSIFNSTGVNLDIWGDILNQPRNGLSDDTEYRIVLLAKIAQNVSQGTAEELIALLTLLTNPTKIIYSELQPAELVMTILSPTPIGSYELIRSVMQKAKAAGVKFNVLVVASEHPFSFAEDPDIDGRGFGDINDPDVGGNFSAIV